MVRDLLAGHMLCCFLQWLAHNHVKGLAGLEVVPQTLLHQKFSASTSSSCRVKKLVQDLPLDESFFLTVRGGRPSGVFFGDG